MTHVTDRRRAHGLPPRTLLRAVAWGSACCCAAALCTAVSGEPAAATPDKVIIATKQPTSLAELIRAADDAELQIKRLDEALEIAVEEYNGAQVRLEALNADLTQVRIDLTRREGELQAKQDLLTARLVWMYKVGDYTWLDALLGSGSLADAESQVDFFRRLGRQDEEDEEEFNALVDQVVELERIVAAKREQALAVEQQIETEQRLIADKLAERKALLRSFDKRITKILGERSALASADARRLARAAGVNLTTIRGTPAQIAVVREALKELGKPYVYAGAGPNVFDCSGLVMFVYAKFGVHVPHFAAYQADYGRRVSYGELQPADLVFFGSPIHHVGIYAGNGLFIHAPHTGDVVKVTVLAQYEMPSACARYTGIIKRIP